MMMDDDDDADDDLDMISLIEEENQEFCSTLGRYQIQNQGTSQIYQVVTVAGKLIQINPELASSAEEQSQKRASWSQGMPAKSAPTLQLNLKGSSLKKRISTV